MSWVNQETYSVELPPGLLQNFVIKQNIFFRITWIVIWVRVESARKSESSTTPDWSTPSLMTEWSGKQIWAHDRGYHALTVQGRDMYELLRVPTKLSPDRVKLRSFVCVIFVTGTFGYSSCIELAAVAPSPPPPSPGLLRLHLHCIKPATFSARRCSRHCAEFASVCQVRRRGRSGGHLEVDRAETVWQSLIGRGDWWLKVVCDTCTGIDRLALWILAVLVKVVRHVLIDTGARYSMRTNLIKMIKLLSETG